MKPLATILAATFLATISIPASAGCTVTVRFEPTGSCGKTNGVLTKHTNKLQPGTLTVAGSPGGVVTKHGSKNSINWGDGHGKKNEPISDQSAGGVA